MNPVVVEAARVLDAEEGLEFQIDTVGGSSGGIAALGDGRVEIAMSSRPLNHRDRERYPETSFVSTPIGTDALAIVVSRDVWDGGVREISRQHARELYEGEIKNWSALGGPDRRVVFFSKEPGRGTWEVFASWLYGDADDAPLVNHLEVGSNEEARNKVGSTPGAVSQLSAAWADGNRVFALSIRVTDGRDVAPSEETTSNGTYPLARSLFLLTDGNPSDGAKRLIDFIRGPRGSEIVRRHGYLPFAYASRGGSEPLRRKVDWVRWASWSVHLFLAVGFFMLMMILFALQSAPVWLDQGVGYLTGKVWHYRANVFGVLPMVYGTLVVSAVAVLLAAPVAVGSALFTSEILSSRGRMWIKIPIELLAGIPSVVYGLLGVFLLRDWIYRLITPFDPLSGDTLLTAGVLLAVMILPTVMTLADDALRSVPASQRRASRGLGLNVSQTAWSISLPQAAPGICRGSSSRPRSGAGRDDCSLSGCWPSG